MTDGEVFGTTDEGEPVQRFSISGGGLTANIMSWGAVLQDLRLAGHDAPLVLGFDRFEDYPAHSPYMGAIAGRYANRIGGGRFTIAGTALSGGHEFPRQAHAAWRREELRQARLGRGAARRGFRHVCAARSGWVDGFSGRARRDLHLPHEDPGHARDRVDRDLRRADALQSRASLLFQSRRRRQRRHSRPPADAGRVEPICRSTTN